MKDRLGDRTRLLHIRDAIEEIESYISRKPITVIESDSMLRNAVLRQLEVIGEAVNKLSESLKNEYPDIDWKAIVVMRNILIHEYFSISVKIIQDTVKTDLPLLKKIVNTMLASF